MVNCGGPQGDVLLPPERPPGVVVPRPRVDFSDAEVEVLLDVVEVVVEYPVVLGVEPGDDGRPARVAHGREDGLDVGGAGAGLQQVLEVRDVLLTHPIDVVMSKN